MREGRINLFSDTQTRPTRAMREAMLEAEVGDEQLGLDPTVNRLCERVAELLGKEAAVFLPSGTMCNEIAILVHCRPGDEVYAHPESHIIMYEGGGPAVLAGASVRPLDGPRGMFSAETLEASIDPLPRYSPCPRLVSIEQTTNLGGGAVWPLNALEDLARTAGNFRLLLHMDGARLLNAAVAAGCSAREMAAFFDSVWIDLSKGLGCPVGAVLAGSAEFIEEAWRWKQRLGGAMRQAGMLAAAGLYALEHHVERLAEDHANARRFADIVTGCEGVDLRHGPVQTNIVFLDIARTGVSAPAVVAHLERRGINLGAFSSTVLRAVTHLDVTRSQVEEAAQALVEAIGVLRA